MSRCHSFSQFLLIGMALAAIPDATAAPIQFSMTGTIDVQFQVGPLPPGIFHGAPFEAILSYDLATSDSRPDDPSRGFYSTTSREDNFLLIRIGESVIRSDDPLTFDVSNDRDIVDPMAIDGFPDDSFSILNVPFLGNFEHSNLNSIVFRWTDPTRMAFDSDALPTTLDPSQFFDPFALNFTPPQFVPAFIEISTFQIDPRVTQFTLRAFVDLITVIPEPSALSLLLVAFVALGHRSAQRHRPFL